MATTMTMAMPLITVIAATSTPTAIISTAVVTLLVVVVVVKTMLNTHNEYYHDLQAHTRDGSQ